MDMSLRNELLACLERPDVQQDRPIQWQMSWKAFRDLDIGDDKILHGLPVVIVAGSAVTWRLLTERGYRPDERRKAPWPDFNGSGIFEGDVILHPNGESGVVVFLDWEEQPTDQWRVDYRDGTRSRLCLQVGGKGQAFVAAQTKDFPAT